MRHDATLSYPVSSLPHGRRQQVTEIMSPHVTHPLEVHMPLLPIPTSLDILFSRTLKGRWAGLQSPHPVPRHPLEWLSPPEISCQIHCSSPLESSRLCWVPSHVGAWGHNEGKKQVEKNSRKNSSDWYTDIVVTPGRHKMDVSIMLNQVLVKFYIGAKWQ